MTDELAESLRRLQGEGYRVAVVVTSDRVDLDKLKGLSVHIAGSSFRGSEVIA